MNCFQFWFNFAFKLNLRRYNQDHHTERVAQRVHRRVARQGGPVQVDPIKPTLNAPTNERLKLKCDDLLSSFPFKFNLRRYTKTLSPPVSVDLNLEAVKRFYEELAVGPDRYLSPSHRHAFGSLVL